MNSGGRITVLKLGGSVLTGAEAYRRAAAFVATFADAGARIVVVVSAEFGHTDSLLREAEQFAAVPDADALALLWSTGECNRSRCSRWRSTRRAWRRSD